MCPSGVTRCNVNQSGELSKNACNCARLDASWSARSSASLRSVTSTSTPLKSDQCPVCIADHPNATEDPAYQSVWSDDGVLGLQIVLPARDRVME